MSHKLYGGLLRVALGPIVVLAVCLLSGCVVYNQPWRTDSNARHAKEVTTSITALRDRSEQRRVADASVEHHQDFTLAFVEFDDQGAYWNRFEADAALFEAQYAAEHGGTTVVVYAHGWKHNASVCDHDVACFRSLLTHLSELETKAAVLRHEPPRHLVGVYLGWRGLSLKTPILKEFTFWARKSTAERVGREGALDFLARLDGLVHSWRSTPENRSREIVIGHSFGADIVFSALEGELKSRAIVATRDYGITPGINPYDPGHWGPISAHDRRRALGDTTSPVPITIGPDAVFLINPAFEASRYETFNRLSQQYAFSGDQLPLIFILSSKGDSATRVAFPLGRRLDTLLERTRDQQQKQELVTAVGNYSPFLAGDLVPCPTAASSRENSSASSSGSCFCPLEALSENPDVENALGTTLFSTNQEQCVGLVDFVPAKESDSQGSPHSPFLVMSMDTRVSRDHSDIFTPYIMSFVTQVAAMNADVMMRAQDAERRLEEVDKNLRATLEMLHRRAGLQDPESLDRRLQLAEWAFLPGNSKYAVKAIDDYDGLVFSSLLERYCHSSGSDIQGAPDVVLDVMLRELQQCGLIEEKHRHVVLNSRKTALKYPDGELPNGYREKSYLVILLTLETIARDKQHGDLAH